MDVSQYLLGVRPTLDGLAIEPHLPAEFTDLTVTRVFRGTTYRIGMKRTGERSVSVFMLGYLADHSEESFQKEDIEKIFTDRYVYQLGAFDKRLHEQEETGTIVKNEDGGYSITPAGRGLVRMYETIDRLYGLDDSLLHSGP